MQEQIFDALRRGANEEALAMARAAVEDSPQSAQPLLWLAMALTASGRREDALAAIDKGIVLDPEDAGLHVHRAGLLLDAREIVAAKDALQKTVALDPNQLDAYLMQAQIALASGDVDEAERQARLAARVAPDHPWTLALFSLVALRRDEPDRALSLASDAAKAAPDDRRVLLALALAYVAKGHHAFAEQAFRKLVEADAVNDGIRLMLAQSLHAQERWQDALDALLPLLADSAKPTPPILRLAADLGLRSGRGIEAKDWSRRALLAMPDRPENLEAFLRTWRRKEDLAQACVILDEAISQAPATSGLWHARLGLETEATAADGLVDRWNEALPDDPAAVEARMIQHWRHGRREQAAAMAHQLVARMPGNASAHNIIVSALKADDPAKAIDHVEGLLSQARNEAARMQMSAWLAELEDAAGRHASAAARWMSLAQSRRAQLLPLPPVSLPADQVPAGAWPEWAGDAQAKPGDFRTLFVWGAPGSCVENVAQALSGIEGFRADRLAPQSPSDGFQRYASVDGLSSGGLSSVQFHEEWQRGLHARGIEGEAVIEWLGWWDNAFLRVLRPHLPDAALLFVVRDPRDMFLEWLAHGAPAQLAIPSLPQAAAWMAANLAQVVDVVHAPLHRAALLKIDGIESDPNGLSEALAGVLGGKVVVPSAPRANLLPAGHWRNYAEALAEPFAMLTPVAMRLGYPET